jgi:hypothetical protein
MRIHILCLYNHTNNIYIQFAGVSNYNMVYVDCGFGTLYASYVLVFGLDEVYINFFSSALINHQIYGINDLNADFRNFARIFRFCLAKSSANITSKYKSRIGLGENFQDFSRFYSGLWLQKSKVFNYCLFKNNKAFFQLLYVIANGNYNSRK